MSIVCGTDFSLYSAEAASAAAAFSKRMNQPLRLLHASPALTKDVPADDPGLRAMWSKLKEEAERLRPRVPELREQVVAGAPEVVLPEEARIAGKLLVLGARGASVGSAWGFGATAARTAQQASTPVLMVQSAEPFVSWEQGQPLKILLGFDGSIPAMAAVHWAHELRRAGPCEVTALQLYYPPVEYTRLGIAHETYLEGHPEIERVLVREMRERLGPDAEGLTLLAKPFLSDSAQELRRYAAANGFGLLILGTHQRRGLQKLWYGSTAESVLQQAPTAVLCVPAPHTAEARGKLPSLRRVLVPTDFSEIANHAIPYAYAQAGSGGEVILLHVVEGPADKALASKDREALVARLRALVPYEAKELSIGTELEIVVSLDPTEAICQAAERLGVDAVALCTRGRSGLGALLFGSVTRGVMEQSRRPVLVVYPPKRT